MRLGQRKKIADLGELTEEGCLISVKMYDHASYVNLFDSKLYSDLTLEQSKKAANETMRAKAV